MSSRAERKVYASLEAEWRRGYDEGLGLSPPNPIFAIEAGWKWRSIAYRDGHAAGAREARKRAIRLAEVMRPLPPPSAEDRPLYLGDPA